MLTVCLVPCSQRCVVLPSCACRFIAGTVAGTGASQLVIEGTAGAAITRSPQQGWVAKLDTFNGHVTWVHTEDASEAAAMSDMCVLVWHGVVVCEVGGVGVPCVRQATLRPSASPRPS